MNYSSIISSLLFLFFVISTPAWAHSNQDGGRPDKLQRTQLRVASGKIERKSPSPAQPIQGGHTWAGLFDALVAFPGYIVPAGDVTLQEFLEEHNPTVEDFCMSPIATSWAWDACVDSTGCGGDGPPPEGSCEQILSDTCFYPSVDYVDYYFSTCVTYLSS